MSKLNVTRRGVIKTGAVAGAGLALPTYLSAASHSGYTNAPTGSTVTLGFNVPQTGPYADEGADELRAYELAVEHLNGGGDGGMLSTFSSKALDGTGILGKKVEYVTGDTQTKSDAARASAKSMIEKDGAIMITGGSSSGVAIAVQGLCQEAGVIFMAGLTHSNDTTGKDKKANGFRHFFNGYMSGAALAPVLAKMYGNDRKAYHLTADYTWGWTQQESIAAATEALGWETVNNVLTPLAATDFSSYIAPVLNSGADVLVLNHYGGNMVNSLTNAVQFGLREKVVNGKDFEIVVPLYSRLMAKGAGANVKGIFGSTNWHWSLQDEGSKAFVKSFGTKYGFPPSQAAHTCYVQTLLYADAAQRAGSFNPCAIAEALEGYEFDGLGNGPTLYRAEDHQCFKDVLVVKGKDNPTSEFDLLEIVEVTPRAQVEYAPDHPMFAGGSLGSCNPGA
ncbi:MULTISPECIES: substrate-binding protein [Mameliella]|jgi:ABC-type branched-subunit amino acid transport system substrate-binding protein|uniref:Branched-chain amino acid ABC transporter, periplasmic substrate-binding protein n=1 Tax=Mameliella alba TaxID=561184 RepID=A0A0B3SID5_9RHOB|nr:MULTISPECIES: substrate-binding protein [Mameliella]MCR9274800.1 substrate-binding protein [Paracoccaceae bacterium]ODM46554.1 branched-chain amino acid ABC transporter substrate-binding protein [Ruegeria sp. PBVC088]KHQ50339.1 Branched-chain amino acid ABC transporter, periplasmic substrate-binding protein [Mameliella alba]MBY6122794.1 substrate-binding protein [Mameliella alba]MDD9731754.1 substrate-binding protein [Mameliella sp. AT18]